MNHLPEVVVVGSNMVDMLSKVPRFPKIGETLIGTSFHLGFGGKGANQAVMAAKLGSQVGIVTKVGDDEFGKMTSNNFQQNGISNQFVYVQKRVDSKCESSHLSIGDR
jgi:ribokinase